MTKPKKWVEVHDFDEWTGTRIPIRVTHPEGVGGRVIREVRADWTAPDPVAEAEERLWDALYEGAARRLREVLAENAADVRTILGSESRPGFADPSYLEPQP